MNTADYDETIQIANKITGEYTTPVIFHCYWNGTLNEKHLYSILSCYYFNVYKHKHRIILWLENNVANQYNTEIQKYAEIRPFLLQKEQQSTNLLNNIRYRPKRLQYYSNFVRCLLLYNYGGIWFDLDCFFLRNFDPLFCMYEDEICLYQWEKENYPNNAIFISLKPRSPKMKHNIEFIAKRKAGWGFQQTTQADLAEQLNLTYDLPLDMLILPCSWFDGGWIENPYNIGLKHFFEDTDKQYDFDTFFKGSFCFHWHNKWNDTIQKNSIVMQLVTILRRNMKELV